MELYILITATTAILWLLYKFYLAKRRFGVVYARQQGFVTRLYRPVIDRKFITYVKLFAADVVFSAIISMLCRVLIAGRVGAAVAATVSLVISINLFMNERQNGAID